MGAARHQDGKEMPFPSKPATLREVNTAKPSATIWSKVQEDAFRTNLVALEAETNAVPVDVLTVSAHEEVTGESHGNFLPLAIEKQVADDLAYVAAVTEGAQSVAAVCLEQHLSDDDTSTLAVRVAGMDVVDDNVKSMLDEIATELQRVSSASSRGESESQSRAAEAIFKLIISQHGKKLLGRLRSRKWEKPAYLAQTHKKSLWQDFENVIHRAQHVYPRKQERSTRESITCHLERLRKSYEDFENTDEDTQIALRRLVRSTYDFCQLPVIAAYASKLDEAHATPQIAAALKTVRQLEKIGAYWRIAKSLVLAAQTYPTSFHDIRLEYITPYCSVPTSIAYEPWAKTCHVHAEIQLVAHYAAGRIHSWPRTIGASKYFCYLCFLFLNYHGKFQTLNTHGRLYDQWTVPDLEEYDDEVREKFSRVLFCMNEGIEQQLGDAKGLVWRPEPMTSRQNLLCYDDRKERELEVAMKKLELDEVMK